MRRFAETCQAVAATTKKNEKVRLVGDYLRSLPLEDAATAALLLTGRAFPRMEETVLAVGGSLIWGAVSRLSGVPPDQMEAVYRHHGDLGDMTAELLAGKAVPSALSLRDVAAAFQELARRRGPTQKLPALEELLGRADALEAKYIVKIITGDLRIGLKESLVEEAMAYAFGKPLAEVQRANMLGGDIGVTLRLAAGGQLAEARLRLFHPLGFMLASAAETAAEAMEYFPSGAVVEDKYDGVRAHAHKRDRQVKLFSRTLDEIVEFPELFAPLAALPGEFVLDGEVVAWRDGRPLPFTDLQKRLGRKQPGLWLQQEIPVSLLAFDLLYSDGELLLDLPFTERRKRLEALLAPFQQPGQSNRVSPSPEKLSPPASASLPEEVGSVLAPFQQPGQSNRASPSPAKLSPPASASLPEEVGTVLAGASNAAVQLAPSAVCSSAEELERSFEAALARGNEGLMAKAPDSPYTPGRRGRFWMKLKRPLATLDVVVVAVEYGHGKRRGLLSDYTFAVRDGGALATIGKAYSGLTDEEIHRLTEFFREHTTEDHGFRRVVEPTVVMEVAFNNIQRSKRHDGGYALRFPRIVRLRPDKPVAEIDTLERVKELYQRQTPSARQS